MTVMRPKWWARRRFHVNFAYRAVQQSSRWSLSFVLDILLAYVTLLVTPRRWAPCLLPLLDVWRIQAGSDQNEKLLSPFWNMKNWLRSHSGDEAPGLSSSDITLVSQPGNSWPRPLSAGEFCSSVSPQQWSHPSRLLLAFWMTLLFMPVMSRSCSCFLKYTELSSFLYLG